MKSFKHHLPGQPSYRQALLMERFEIENAQTHDAVQVSILTTHIHADILEKLDRFEN